MMARFRQICCRDISLFQPLPWFAGGSSLDSMGSNARCGFLDLLQNFGARRKFRGKVRGMSPKQLWVILAPWMVEEAKLRLGSVLGASPPLDTMTLSHALCEKRQQEERDVQKKRSAPRSNEQLRYLAGQALQAWGGVFRFVMGICEGLLICREPRCGAWLGHRKSCR